MKKLLLRRLGLSLVMLGTFLLPIIAGAQVYFQYNANQRGDVLAGFRKTGSFQELNEMVVNFGNLTNYLALPPGTVTNMFNFSKQLTNMCPDGFGNLQWSVFASTGLSGNGPWTNILGVFPQSTLYYTIPRTNVNIQTTPPNRNTLASQNNAISLLEGIGSGAATISSELVTTNMNNNSVLVLEPISLDAASLYSTLIASDLNYPGVADFGGYTFTITVENTTSNKFTSAAVSDFYQACPSSSKTSGTFIDPFTGKTNGAPYFVGYFTLNPNGTMTFTRASTSAPAPVANFSGTPTKGFTSLKVVFADASTGSITNWIWNFGDGHAITNTTGGSVTNTYAAAGTYTVTLTVTGSGGANTSTQTSYIMASPTPTIGGVTLSNGKLVFSGANCPAGVPYRILTSTNLTSWTPIATNTFLSNGTFAWTNATVNTAGYFRLVSP